MTLDKTQIEVVESFIVKSDINFVDVKWELLDHIVCDIEAVMEEEHASFEEAFGKTKLKWKPLFSETHNMWMGLAYIKPKIVIDKCGALMKKTMLYAFGLASIGSVLMWFLVSAFSVNTSLIYAFLYKWRWVLFAVSTTILVYHSWHILRAKVKTVFGYCYMRQFSLLPIFTLLINPTEHISTSFWGRLLPLVFLVMFITYYYFAFKIYSEHMKYVRRNVQLTQ